MSEKSKNILLGVLIVGLVSMTVAYAALSTSLNINGTANVAATKWDIHFEDWARDADHSNVDLDTAATEDLTGMVTKIHNFTVTLSKPGDKVRYNFKIANRGTIDARKTGFTKSIKVDSANAVEASAYGTQTEGGVLYTIQCSNDTPLVANATTPANATPATCYLELEYGSLDNGATANGATGQTSNTAGEDQTATNPAKTIVVNADWTYQQ